ncbi:MAG: transposase [Steroidobacteraceae bacterium]
MDAAEGPQSAGAAAARRFLDALLANMTSSRTARAWQYREQLREIMSRKQPNIARALLKQWCTNVMRSKVEPMKAVAVMIRKHFEGVLAWVETRQTNGFLKPSTACSRPPNARRAGMGPSAPSAW